MIFTENPDLIWTVILRNTHYLWKIRIETHSNHLLEDALRPLMFEASSSLASIWSAYWEKNRSECFLPILLPFFISLTQNLRLNTSRVDIKFLLICSILASQTSRIFYDHTALTRIIVDTQPFINIFYTLW